LLAISGVEASGISTSGSLEKAAVCGEIFSVKLTVFPDCCIGPDMSTFAVDIIGCGGDGVVVSVGFFLLQNNQAKIPLIIGTKGPIISQAKIRFEMIGLVGGGGLLESCKYK
jgi:hypothetical protein